MMRNIFEEGRVFSTTRRLGLALLAMALCGEARGLQNVSLAWNANTDTNVAGYYLYFGTNSTNLSSRVDVGNNTTATITGLSGKSVNYYFQATAYNNSRMESPPSNQAQFTTSSNSGPSLAALPSVAGNVNSLVVVTNNVSDTDKVAHTLSYSLGAGAPPAMRINTNTGRLIWVPRMADGGTTNAVTVQVVDNFGLYSAQTLNVAVSNAAQVTLSPVVVALGNTGNAQVTLTCSAPLTNVSFELDFPSNRVSNVTVANLIPGIANITQQPAGAAHSKVTISALSGQTLSGTETVAQIGFTAVTGLPSAFGASVPSVVTSVQANGQPVPNNFGINGNLVFVGSQPLATSTILTNNQPGLILYGQAGKTFQLQSSTNPMSTNGWTAYATSAALGTNLTQVFTNVPVSTTAKYYRILAL